MLVRALDLWQGKSPPPTFAGGTRYSAKSLSLRPEFSAAFSHFG